MKPVKEPTMKGWTVEEIQADLLELARPEPKPPPKPAPEKPKVARLVDQERSTKDVINRATTANKDLANRLEETTEGRRQARMAYELAQYNAENPLWHKLVSWRQSVARVEEIVRLPYYRRSATVGPEDSDADLHVSPEDQTWGNV